MIRKIIIAAVILVILIIIKKLISKPAVKENVSRKSYGWLKIALAIAFIGAIGFALFSSLELYINKNGDSKFAKDIQSFAEQYDIDSDKEGGIRISVHLDEITIGGRKYHDLESVKSIIRQNQEDGNSFVLVDDYASKDMYLTVQDILEECGVEKNSISYEEVE